MARSKKNIDKNFVEEKIIEFARNFAEETIKRDSKNFKRIILIIGDLLSWRNFFKKDTARKFFNILSKIFAIKNFFNG